MTNLTDWLHRKLFPNKAKHISWLVRHSEYCKRGWADAEEKANDLEAQLTARQFPLGRDDLRRLSSSGDVRLKFAFELDGVKYYEVPNWQELPTRRAYEAMTVQDELGTNTGRPYLLAWIKQARTLVNEARLADMGAHIKALDERTQWVASHELMYRLAAIWFVREDEDLAGIDESIIQEKIAAWQACESLGEFFARKPVAALFGFSAHSQPPSAGYLRGQLAEDVKSHLALLKQLQAASGSASSKAANDGAISSLSTAVESLRKQMRGSGAGGSAPSGT